MKSQRNLYALRDAIEERHVALKESIGSDGEAEAIVALGVALSEFFDALDFKVAGPEHSKEMDRLLSVEYDGAGLFPAPAAIFTVTRIVPESVK